MLVGDEGAWDRGTRKRLASNLEAKDGEDARRLTFPESIDQLADIESSSVLEFVLVVEFHGEDVAVGLDWRDAMERSQRGERYGKERVSQNEGRKDSHLLQSSLLPTEERRCSSREVERPEQSTEMKF